MRRVLLGSDARLRRPLALTLLTCAVMAASIVSMEWVAAADLAQARPVHWWALASGLWALVCFALIRSGRTRRWRDPAFTAVQIGAAFTSNAAAYVIAGQARGIVLPLLALVMVFGVFNLSERQIKALLAYSLTLYAVAGAVIQWGTQDAPAPALATVYMLAVIVVLTSSTVLALRIRAMRQLLKRQKQELASAVRHIHALATRDELTGLPNRRYMQEALRVACLSAQRSRRPLLLAQLDLDHFKQINDTHGHAVGDQVLKAFAAAAQKSLRASDVLARWGGEEFVLMLVDTTPEQGRRLLERLRAAVADAALTLEGGVRVAVTVSIGVALLGGDEACGALLKRSDDALYRAKRLGRDRIACAEPAPPVCAAADAAACA
ncbi:GGDEF domain-containing protein [Comamonas flocculans]|nr:sensor domain-containing diguanylate cyclase [Comamonas flocculans]